MVLLRGPLTAAVLLAYATPAAAQRYGTVVSASRHEQDAFDSARAVDSVSPKGPQSVGEALEEVSGVHVQRSARSKPTPVIRGLTGHRVLVIFDELRLNDATTRIGGNSHLGLLDPSSVGRIEVVRGPASVLYGSDALGGVVRVVPAEAPRVDGTAASLEATVQGAERHGRAHGVVEGVHGGRGLRLSGGGGAFGEVRPGAGGPPQPYSGHDEWALSARLIQRSPHGQAWGAAFHGARQLNAPRTDLSTPEDVQITTLNQRDMGYAWVRGRAGALRWKASAGAILRRIDTERRRGGGVAGERHDVNSLQGGFTGGVRVWGQATHPGGVDLARDAVGVTSDEVRGRYLDGTRYQQGGLYALLEQPLGPSVLVEAGARLTGASVAGPADQTIEGSAALRRSWTGIATSAGARLALSPGLAIMGSVMTGFRSPNLEDLQAFGRGARGFGVPNPDIGEERTLTVDLGLKVRDRLWALQAFAFATRLSDLIVRVPGEVQGRTEIDGAPVVTRANSGGGELVGMELEASIGQGTEWSASMGAAGSFGREGTEPLSKVAPPSVRLTGRHGPPDGRWWVGLALWGVAAQSRLSAADQDDVRICPEGPSGCDSTPGHVRSDLEAGARLMDGIRLALAVRNLGDVAYRPFASGVVGAGRSVHVSVGVER